MKDLLLLLLLALLLFPKPAHAYLDPGSGSYFIQILLGLILGSIFTLKLFWKKIKVQFKRLFSPSSKDENKRK